MMSSTDNYQPINTGLAGAINLVHLCEEGIAYLYKVHHKGPHDRIALKATAFTVRVTRDDDISVLYPDAPQSVVDLLTVSIENGLTLVDIAKHAPLTSVLKQYQDVRTVTMPQSLPVDEQDKADWVRTVSVTDPDSELPVEVDIYKDRDSGGLFGVDGSYLVTLGDDDPVSNPFNGNDIQLVEPEVDVERIKRSGRVA